MLILQIIFKLFFICCVFNLIFYFLFLFLYVGYFYLLSIKCILAFIDCIQLSYFEEDPSDELMERFLPIYVPYIEYNLEWELEYAAYFVDEFDDENGDSRELDEFEFSEAPFIILMWFFMLKNRFYHLSAQDNANLNYVKSLQLFDLVKKTRSKVKNIVMKTKK